MTDKDTQKQRSGRVERRIKTARDSLPGERNDLPEGALGGVPTVPQATKIAIRRRMHQSDLIEEQP
jgi:hypothetical protein